jgi:nucleoside-diphosphate-sugar epimerase
MWTHTYDSLHPDRTWLDYSMNYKDQAQIERMLMNSNVAINLLGPRHKIKKFEDFEWINIEVAERIAKACTKLGIHRLIHFSAAGAEEDSPSFDFKTKKLGEEVVKKAFPNVTILRPCPVFGLNDNFASIIRGQLNFFWNKFVPVYDDCTTKKQPIRENDIAKCVLNALKLEESKGRTYELGGPHALTMLEIYEIIFNIMRIRPTLAYVNPEPLKILGKYIYNWPYFSLELLRKRIICLN